MSSEAETSPVGQARFLPPEPLCGPFVSYMTKHAVILGTLYSMTVLVIMIMIMGCLVELFRNFGVKFLLSDKPILQHQSL